MTTVRVTRPLSHWLPDIASRESVPLSWLSTLHQRIKMEVPDDAEISCGVHGLQVATVTWEKTLSPLEQLQATVADMQAKAAQIKALLPIEGGVSAAQADKMREILG